MLIKKKLRKYYEYALTKVKIMWEQKKYVNRDTPIKYILKKRQGCKWLVVVFSSCTRKGIKARYNYMRTLKNIQCNRLFILDDYAADGRGSYYIGENMQFNEEKATVALINDVIKRLDISQAIFCGSSKGGWASLYFGSSYENSIIISGGPQYFLGDYLKASGNLDALFHITNDCAKEKVDFINYYLENKLINNDKKASQTIYLHYSDCEHTYNEHIQYLLNTLQKNNYIVKRDVADYQNHSDISYYYPDFLLSTINNILIE